MRCGHPRGTKQLPHREGSDRKTALSWRGFSHATVSRMRIKWFLAAFVFSIAIALLEQWALGSYLYWRYVWFDVPMHLLGGLTIGTFLVPLLGQFRPILYVLGFAVIALGWEVFEFAFVARREANFIFDTSLDLLMDALGGALVYIVARFTLWRSA